MQRIRTIKPELFTHELLYDLEQKEGLPIRFAFTGLFTVCDREGRFLWRPRMLKTHILPYDNVDFERILNVLVTNSLLIRYEVDGNQYGCIPTWLKHQKIRPDEAKSSLPEPPADLLKKAAAAPNSFNKNVDNSSETNFPNEPVTNSLRTRNELVPDPYRGNGTGKERNSSIELTFFTDVKNISSPSDINLEKQISNEPNTEPKLEAVVVNLVQPEKKEGKKKTERTAEEKALFTKVRQEFEKFYEEKYGSKYYFDGGKDAQAVYALIKKINFKLKENGGEIFDEATTLKAFNDFCAAAHRSDGFVHDHFTFSILNQQFNSIFSLVKSIQNGTATAPNRTTRMSATDAINYVVQKRAWMRRNGQQP